MLGNNRIRWVRKIIPVIAVIFLLLPGCNDQARGKRRVIIFHAGSLSVPFKKLAEEYGKIHPDVRILLESAGSLVCARKITELKKPCDIMASADYFVIDELLVPEYADWSIRFATNEIVIAFHDKSKYSSVINPGNWTEVLLRDDVIYGRSDPDSDPCGYRSVLAIMLAEKYYGKPGLAEKMLKKNRNFIRPKEVDLVALAGANAIDYMFQYKSVALQHGFSFIELPAGINLSDPHKNDIYRSVSIDIAGRSPGQRMKVTGDYINYSLTLLRDAPRKEEAISFIDFMLSTEGEKIFRDCGQEPLIPPVADQPGLIPELLKKYINTEKTAM